MSSIREQAVEIVKEWADAHQVDCAGPGTKARLVTAIEQTLRDERERALTDAARQECVFCAGVEGHNPVPVPAETDAGSYVHRNDPPHGLAGIYCKAARIRALMNKED